MNLLFIHNNFPGQYLHIARAMAHDPQTRVAAIGSSTSQAMEGVGLTRYNLTDVDVSTTHPFARRFDLECYRAEQVLYALSSLTSTGFKPDLIMAHPGWGETLPLRTIFPDARILLYCEFFYGTHGRDVGFDPEFPETGADGHVALHLKNAATLLALTECDVGIAPTEWQRSTFPREYQHKITTIHEGVDVDVAKPKRDATFQLPSGRTLDRGDEVVSFVARSLEPLRGFHTFMRALPRIMTERPHAQIIIVGSDGVSYGASPPSQQTWKSIFLNEVADQIDQDRIHFTGHLAYADYLTLLQISSAHVYLTYPFVLSWSLLEAMSTGCVVIGSDTPPVREVVNGKNGIIVPFFDFDLFATRVIEALTYPERFASMRNQARQTILDRYDTARICLPKMMDLIKGLLSKSEP
jgi:glycosyltransferase involved in cell wall biosynthesis